MPASACRAVRQATVWNGSAAHAATGVASTRATHCQPRNCSAGIIDSTITGAPSTAATISRRRRSATRSSLASGPSPAGSGRWAP